MYRKYIVTAAFGRSWLVRLAVWAGALLLSIAASHQARASINVTNFGAKGDLLTLSNIRVVSNSTALVCPSATFKSTDVGKIIQVFGGGLYQNPSNQTLIATITSVSSSSNITVAIPAGRTFNGLTGLYGTENSLAISNAIASAGIPTDTVIFPAGNYLMIPRVQVDYRYTNASKLGDQDQYISQRIFRGGLVFVGQGNATLTGLGGWTAFLDNAVGYNASRRGTLFALASPMTNNFPVVFTNLDFYGGDVGYVGNVAYPPAGSTGLGWDGSHHAIAIINGSGGPVSLIDSFVIQDCKFYGWRGEMVIGTTDAATNTSVTIANSEFYDGNATALNIPYAHNWVSNYFHDTYQIEEFYRSYAKAPSYFQGNISSNIIGGAAIALNGGYYGNPTYAIRNNSFLKGQFVLFTTPASEVLFTGNNVRTGQGIGIGATGYQNEIGMWNSNIVVALNTFDGAQYPLHIQGGGDNSAVNVSFFSNQVNNAWGLGTGYGWSTNINVFNNTGSNCGRFAGESLQGQYFVDVNNQYAGIGLGDDSTTNYIFTYAQGSSGRMMPIGTFISPKFGLDNRPTLKIPAGATMTISNSSTRAYELYNNFSFSGVPATVIGGGVARYSWTNGVWQRISSMLPPSNLQAFPPGP